MRGKSSSLPGRKSTSIQFMSDVHLETNDEYNKFDVLVTAPYLLLAGDIGRLVDFDALLRFLAKQTNRQERVFFVPSNHGFYRLNHEDIDTEAKKLPLEPDLQGKLTLSHQARYDIPDSSLTILGYTLWSNVPPEDRELVASARNSFRQIKSWETKRHNDCHEAELAWLKAQLDEIRDSFPERTVVVVTHHTPKMQQTSSPVYENSPLTSAFSTDLLSQDQVQWRGAKYWVSGHTHQSNRFQEAEITSVSNRRGYVMLSMGFKAEKADGEHQFNPSATIQVA